MRAICESLVTGTTTTTTVRTIFFDVPRAARVPAFKLSDYKDSYQNPPSFDCSKRSIPVTASYAVLKA